MRTDCLLRRNDGYSKNLKRGFIILKKIKPLLFINPLNIELNLFLYYDAYFKDARIAFTSSD